jgi:hypothetical protein
MDNVQNCDSYINIPSSQTYGRNISTDLLSKNICVAQNRFAGTRHQCISKGDKKKRKVGARALVDYSLALEMVTVGSSAMSVNL